MEQMNNTLMSVLQAMATQVELPKTGGKSDAGETGDFQKLLDQKAQSAKTESQAGSQTESEKTEAAPVTEKQEGPVQEDVQSMAKRLMQAGLVTVDPSSVYVFQEETPVTEEDSSLEVLQPVLVTDAQEDGAQTWTQSGSTVLADQGESFQQELQSQTEVQPKEETPEEVQAAPQAVQAEASEKTEAPETHRTQLAEEPVQTQDDGVEVKVTDANQAPQRLFQDVRSVPVKVGETYQAEQPEQADVAKQIDSQLTQALQKGDSTVRIQLTPETLGTVTVEVSKSADGILRIALSAASSETRGLLERHAASLQGMLSSRTDDTVQVEVQRQQESQQDQNQSYDGHNGHAQDERQRHQQHRDADSQDFVQQMRLGLISTDAEV